MIMMRTKLFILLLAAALKVPAQEFSFSTSPEAKTSLAFYYDDKNINADLKKISTSVTAQFAGDKLIFFTPASITVWNTDTKRQVNQLTLDRHRKSLRAFPHFISFTEGASSSGVVFQPESLYSNFPFVTTKLPDTLINFDPDTYYDVFMENLDNRNFHFWHRAGEQLRDYFYDAEKNKFYYHRNEWARPFSTTYFNVGGHYRYDDLSKSSPTAAHLFSLETKGAGDIYFADFTLIFYDMKMYMYEDESRWYRRSLDGTGMFRGTALPSVKPIDLPHTKKKGYYLWSSAFEFPYIWLTYGSTDEGKEKGSDIHFVEINMLTNKIERQQSTSEYSYYEIDNEKVFGYRNVWHMMASLYADSLRKNISPDAQSLTISAAGTTEPLVAGPANYYSLKNTASGKVTVAAQGGKQYTLNLGPGQALLSVAINNAGDKMGVAIGKKGLSTGLKNTNRRFYFYDTYFYLVDLKTNTVAGLTDAARYQEQMNQLKDSYKPAGSYFDPYKVK